MSIETKNNRKKWAESLSWKIIAKLVLVVACIFLLIVMVSKWISTKSLQPTPAFRW